MTLICWKAGKSVVWGVAATNTTDASYIDSFSREARAAAESVYARCNRLTNQLYNGLYCVNTV